MHVDDVDQDMSDCVGPQEDERCVAKFSKLTTLTDINLQGLFPATDATLLALASLPALRSASLLAWVRVRVRAKAKVGVNLTLALTLTITQSLLCSLPTHVRTGGRAKDCNIYSGRVRRL